MNDYLEAEGDNKRRADVIDAYHERLAMEGIDFDIRNNFGAMINVLFGGL